MSDELRPGRPHLPGWVLVTDMLGTRSTIAEIEAGLAPDAGVERRGLGFATVCANVASPATGELWFTFGGCPAASRGRWMDVAWPW